MHFYVQKHLSLAVLRLSFQPETGTGVISISIHRKRSKRQQIDAISVFKDIQIAVSCTDTDHIGNASPLPGGGTHPQHIMISPLNINRMVLDQFFHDNMGARSSVVNITHNMKMVYRQPLDQLT